MKKFCSSNTHISEAEALSGSMDEPPSTAHVQENWNVLGYNISNDAEIK